MILHVILLGRFHSDFKSLFLLCNLVTSGIKKTKARAQMNRADISVICRIF